MVTWSISNISSDAAFHGGVVSPKATQKLPLRSSKSTSLEEWDSFWEASHPAHPRRIVCKGAPWLDLTFLFTHQEGQHVVRNRNEIPRADLDLIPHLPSQQAELSTRRDAPAALLTLHLIEPVATARLPKTGIVLCWLIGPGWHGLVREQPPLLNNCWAQRTSIHLSHYPSQPFSCHPLMQFSEHPGPCQSFRT